VRANTTRAEIVHAAKPAATAWRQVHCSSPRRSAGQSGGQAAIKQLLMAGGIEGQQPRARQTTSSTIRTVVFAVLPATPEQWQSQCWSRSAARIEQTAAPGSAGPRNGRQLAQPLLASTGTSWVTLMACCPQFGKQAVPTPSSDQAQHASAPGRGRRAGEGQATARSSVTGTSRRPTAAPRPRTESVDQRSSREQPQHTKGPITPAGAAASCAQPLRFRDQARHGSAPPGPTTCRADRQGTAGSRPRGPKQHVNRELGREGSGRGRSLTGPAFTRG